MTTRKPEFEQNRKRILMTVLAAMCLSAPLSAQRIQNTSNGNLSAMLNLPATPGTSNTPVSNSVQFRLRSNNSTGYRVTASTTFSTSTSAPASGGRTIAATDIGVGITSITAQNNVIQPRTDTITSGFSYNPGSVTAANGRTPYTGRASGQATTADLVNSPNLTLLSGPRIAANQTAGGGQNFLTVTMTFGLLPQYWTPGGFTAVVTLTIADQP